jgi:hypothetical protein
MDTGSEIGQAISTQAVRERRDGRQVPRRAPGQTNLECDEHAQRVQDHLDLECDNLISTKGLL